MELTMHPVSKLPSFAEPVSQFVTASQFSEPRFQEMLAWFGWGFGLNRKLWEYLYILNVLEREGLSDRRLLGFGCGMELIPGLLTMRGAAVVATDYAEAADRDNFDWASRGVNELMPDHLVNRGARRELIEFRHVDMNMIPEDLSGFDALWSCGSLEHIGGLQPGMDFVVNAMACLRPGGIAVHTTEFNTSPGADTLETPALSLFREGHIRELIRRLKLDGHQVDLNWTLGDSPDDTYVDHDANYHRSLRADVCGFAVTSIGLIVRKGPE